MIPTLLILEQFIVHARDRINGRQNGLRHVYTHCSSRGMIHAISFMGHVAHITGVAGRPLGPPKKSAACRERRWKAPIGARAGSRPTEYRARSAYGRSYFIRRTLAVTPEPRALLRATNSSRPPSTARSTRAEARTASCGETAHGRTARRSGGLRASWGPGCAR